MILVHSSYILIPRHGNFSRMCFNNVWSTERSSKKPEDAQRIQEVRGHW